MKLYFIGADHEVTGSAHLLELGGKYYLLDYGMEQGKDVYENAELPVSPSEIEAVFLSHAHMDHAGRLPQLVKLGFRGKIYCTKATRDLCEILLKDSAHIQENEAEWKNRKAKRAGKEAVLPLYTVEDVEECMEYFETVSYGVNIPMSEHLTVSYHDAGHILGSAMIQLTCREFGVTKTILYTGDIGNTNVPILNDPCDRIPTDYVIMETTYGNRVHDKVLDLIPILAHYMQKTFEKGGDFVVPCFAVGRTQEMLYFLREIQERKLISLPYEVYLDSPLATEATRIFELNTFGYYDEESIKLMKEGDTPLRFPGLHLTTSVEESKRINETEGCKVILASSGMCDAGRIRHHLKHHLWQPNATICFVGYQAEGTLGRRLLDGEKNVKLFSEEIHVSANLVELQDMSAHADQNGLKKWLDSAGEKPERVFLVHGEDAAIDAFQTMIPEYANDAPYSGSIYDLLKGDWIYKAKPKENDVKPAEEFVANQELMNEVYDLEKELHSIVVKCARWETKNIQHFIRDFAKFLRKWK